MQDKDWFFVATTVKQHLSELASLAQDRAPARTAEIHSGNEWYGHAAAIKHFLGLPTDYSIKAAIEHGPKFGSTVEEFEFKAAVPAMFLYGSFRYPPLLKVTNKLLFTVGSILSYAPHMLSDAELAAERRRLGKTLLVFPTHGTHHIDHQLDLESYCKDLQQLAKDFDSVQVCMYWREITRGWHQAFSACGFEVVTAGHMYDPNFLSRLKSIIDPATLVTTNKMGTHFGYAIQMGKPVYYLANQSISFVKSNQGNPEVFAKWASWGDVHTFNENEQLCQASAELRSTISAKQQELANRYWGLDEVKSKAELIEIIMIAEEIYQQGPKFYEQNPFFVHQQVMHYLNTGQYSKVVTLANEGLRQRADTAPLQVARDQALKELERKAETSASSWNHLSGKAEEVCSRDIPGDFVECRGSGAGPSPVATVARAHSKRNRDVWIVEPEQIRQDLQDLRSVISLLHINQVPAASVKGTIEAFLPRLASGALIHVDAIPGDTGLMQDLAKLLQQHGLQIDLQKIDEAAFWFTFP